MAKDPAILWYWSDWNSGTSTLTRFLKGCYMDLLHAQFNNGRLSISEIKTVLGTDFGQAWPTLQKKFKQDNDEFFYNERLEIEKQKRQNYVQSRQKNLKTAHMDKHMDDHMGKHMGPHMDNVNVNTNENVFNWDVEREKFLQDGKYQLKFCTDKNLTIAQFDSLAAEFLSDLDLKEDFKPIKELRNHFTNWFNKKKENDGKANRGPHSAGATAKPGTSEARMQRAKNWGRT